MIFKTFDSDIDNMSSRWGMFGKSFSDIGDTITAKWKQVTDYVTVTNDATISGMMSAWKGTSPIQFLSDDNVVSILNDYNKALDKGAEATAKFFEAGTGNDFMNSWLKQLKGAPATMDDYKGAVARAELAQNGFTASMVASKVAALALNVAVSMGVSLAISALIKLVDNLVHANEKAIEKAEKLRDTYNDFKETNASNVKTLNNLKDEFEELSNGVSQYGDNISLTTEQYTRYQEIVQQIVGMSPSLAEGYDTENGYLADKNKLLERAIELQELEYRNELRKRTNLTGDLKTSMEGHIAEYRKSLDDGRSNTDFSNALWQVFNTFNRDNYDSQSMARDIMESLGVKDIDKEIEKYINENGYWQNDKFWNDYCDQISSNLDVVTHSLTAEEVGLDDTVFEQNIEKLESYAEQYNDMKDSVKSANESIQTDLGYIAEYADGYSDLSKEQQKFVADYLKQFDISDITSENFIGILKYDENKMASVKNQIKKFVEDLSEDDSTKQALTDLYAPPSDTETVEEYKKRIDSSLKIIREYCENNGIEIPVGISEKEVSVNSLENSYKQTIENAKEKYGEDLTTFFEENSINTQEEIDKWREITQSCNTALEAEKKYLEIDFPDNTPTLSDIFSLKNSDNSLTELGKINEEIDKFQSAYATLKETMDSYNETGTFTLDQVQGIVALGDEYLKYLMDENGELQLNEEALNNVALARKNEMRVKALSNLMDNLESITNEKDALSYLETQLLDTAQSYDDFTKSRIKAWTEKALESGEISESTINKIRKAFENQAYAINEMFDKIDPASVYTKSSSASKSAAKDATDNIKDQIEAYMSYQQASLESGKIDYNTYCNTVKNYLTNMYHSGKIAAEDYHTYIGKMLDNQLKVYDSALKAILSRIQKEIDAWQKKIDDLKDANEKLTDEQEVYNKALSYAQDLIQKQIDGYDDLIDKIDESSDKLNQQKDDLDGILSAIYKVYDDRIDDLNKQSDTIQEQIDLLNDENSALDLQYRKQQALAALDKAKQQRTKKIYSEEKGFFYTQDEDDIREKEKELQDIQNEELIASLNKEKDALADSVKELEKYKDLWSEISDFYENEANKNLLIGLFGDDYKDKVLENNISDIEDFKKNYLDIQQKLNDNEELKKSYEEKKKYYDDLKNKWGDLSNAASDEEKRQAAIKAWGAEFEKTIMEGRESDLADFRDRYLAIQNQINSNEELIKSFEEKKSYYEQLKQQWSSISSAYEDAVNEQYTAQLMGANWEKDVLSGRLDILEDFKKKYIDIQQAIADAAREAAKAQYEAAQAVGSAQVPGTGNGTGDTKQQYKAYIGEEPIGTYDSKEEAERAVEAVIEQRSDYSAKKAVEKLTDKRNANQVYESTKSGIGSDLTHKVRIEKFHTGLLNGIVGESSKKNDFEFLKQYGLKKVEIPAILQKGEAVLTEEQIKNLAYNLRNSGIQQNMMKTPDYSKMANSISTNTVQQPITITFGDIHVEGVQDVDGFADAIVKYLPGRMLQAINKR